MWTSKRPGLVAVLVAGFVGSSLLVFAPSLADIAHFRDARNETSTSLDIESVKVNNATRHPGKVIVTVHQDELIAGDEVSIYVDTRLRNAGPEYLYAGRAESEYLVWRIPNWRARGRKISWRCADVVASSKQDWTRVLFSRRCFGTPHRVRVGVRIAAEASDGSTLVDWARGQRTFLPWVPPAVTRTREAPPDGCNSDLSVEPRGHTWTPSSSC